MKRFAYYIACCSLVALFSCTHDDIDEVLTPVGDGKITIQSTLDDMVITRAEVDDTTPERTITHIDIFAIDESGNIDYYERNVTGNNGGNAENGAGTLTLGVSRRAKDADDNFIFEQGVNYKFILVANAVATEADMQEATTLSDLEKLVQDDSFETSFVGGDSSNEGATGSTPSMSRQTLLHLSGTNQGNNPDKETPQTFLMDAVATDSDNNEKWVVNPASSTVPNLNLSAEFKRAASKIIVNIKQGADVEFRTQLDSEFAQYDFYKLPASTFVLPNESKLVNIQLINTAPMKPNKETFIWKYEDASAENPRNENSIQIIGYAYSHSWSDVDLTNETSLILNIPMMWNMDDSDDHSKEAEAPRSWYKVPLSQGKKFERNKCYIVNIEINAVGAATRSTAIELRDIEYVTLDWQDVNINVGDTSENPEYLTLNTNLVNIYNMNFDYTQLEFSSSSYIPNNFANENSSTTEINNIKNNGGIILTDAYYYNYLDQKVELSTPAGDKYKIYANIRSTAEQDVLNGKINIDSPFVGNVESHSNAIRYLVFEVYNQTGQKATFTVVQYPTLYITNEMGWYSYRSDFGGTTYEKKGNPNYSGVRWSNGGWSYGYYETGFFNSKVTNSTNNAIYYYYYNGYSNSASKSQSIQGLNNPRMYHVHVTATSSKYTVGKPRLDADGYTESSLENSRLVSPSFMIASQLGATMAPSGGVNQAKQHCEQYVEVTKNAVYDDWRLPTAAEIEIIASHQDASDAMATVMTGWAYYCSYNVIDGKVVYYQTTGKSISDTAVRCVRDAY